MNAHALSRTHASASTLATVSSFVLLKAVGCISPDLEVIGSDPEDLTAIAAVLNKTDGQLTVTVSDSRAADVLEPDEAIVYEVSQSMEPLEFVFLRGIEVMPTESLLLFTGGEDPGFATGVLTVSPGEDNETLTVDADIELSSVFTPDRPVLTPADTVYLIINATPFTILLGNFTEAGTLIAPNAHSKLILMEGDIFISYIQVRGAENPADAPELTHTFGTPASLTGQASAFIAFVTLQGDELAVETQSAGFRRLDAYFSR